MRVSVADVMSDRVIAVRENAEFAEIVAVMRRCHIASLPVIDAENHVVGIVSEDDLVRREAEQGSRPGLADRLRRRNRAPRTLARDLMSSPAVTVTAAASVREAARLMRRCGIHQLPVVDPDDERLRGIVTRSDLLAVYERPSEDIRQEILAEIIEDVFGLDAARFAVTVRGGIVSIRGEVERRSAAVAIADAIDQVDGVVAVENHLTYEWDDSAPTPPSFL